MPIISTVNGNLITRALEGRYVGIAHGANCQNTMKSGIAPAICKVWPGAREADQSTIKGSEKKLGRYSFYFSERHDLFVANLYTQFHWNGRKRGVRDLDYEALYKCFCLLEENYQGVNSNRPLGIPMIGAGLAGGDWDAIRLLINLATPRLPIEVVMLH